MSYWRGGSIVLREGDRRISDPGEMRRVVKQEVDRSLRWLGRAALLVG